MANPLSRSRGGFFVALLALLVASAFLLRLFGFDWGDGQQLHPDEIGITNAALQRVNWPPGASIGGLLNPATSPLNPRSGGAAYPYGALPLYLGKAAASIFTAGDYQGILLTGRILAALFDTATMLLVFVVGARLWGRWWGLFAAALYGFGILPLQISHFYISEPFMAFFMAATLLASLLYYQQGRPGMLLMAGIAVGLALACKLSAAPVLVLPFAALALRELPGKAPRASLSKIAHLAMVGLAGAFAGLFVGDPYGVLDAPAYLQQVSYQATVQTGAADLWFTRRYVGTWPVVYPWWQMALLGVGPLVGLIGTLGACIAAVWTLTRNEWKYALLLVGALVYFASIAFLEAKWVRYLLPLVPYLCLFATVCVMWLLQQRWAKRSRGAGWVVAGVPLLSVALGATAFMSIYTHEHTLVQASEWLYANVQAGGKIGVEINDGVLPLALKGHPEPAKEYNIVQLRMLADFPSEQASTYLRDGLRNIDYLVVGSIRGLRTVPAMPWRYPVQERYYDLLFTGKLGFVPVYTAASYPSLLGISFPDDNRYVDASFVEYDHPTVRIFKKAHDLGDAEWNSLFAGAVKQPSLATRNMP